MTGIPSLKQSYKAADALLTPVDSIIWGWLDTGNTTSELSIGWTKFERMTYANMRETKGKASTGKGRRARCNGEVVKVPSDGASSAPKQKTYINGPRREYISSAVRLSAEFTGIIITSVGSPHLTAQYSQP
jgi:hypothetical protein